jgi:hypothetical protein
MGSSNDTWLVPLLLPWTKRATHRIDGWLSALVSRVGLEPTTR